MLGTDVIGFLSFRVAHPGRHPRLYCAVHGECARSGEILCLSLDFSPVGRYVLCIILSVSSIRSIPFFWGTRSRNCFKNRVPDAYIQGEL